MSSEIRDLRAALATAFSSLSDPATPRPEIDRALPSSMAAAFGTVSLLFGGWLYFLSRPLSRELLGSFTQYFQFGWSSILLLIAVYQAWHIIWTKARRMGHSLRPHIGLCLGALLASLIGFTNEYWHWKNPSSWTSNHWVEFNWTPSFWLSWGWMLCYGMGLLAGKSSAPRSQARLGWSFLAAAVTSFCLLTATMLGEGWTPGTHVPTLANLLVASTFGLLHLTYAACAWAAARRSSGTKL